MKTSWILILVCLFTTFSCVFNEPEDDGLQRKPLVVVADDATENLNQAKYGKTKLSDYGFFAGEMKLLNPAEGVLPYEVNAPLFTDYTHKKRFIYLPKGKQMTYQEREALDFPDSTIIIKNFYYTAEQTSNEERIMETRLLLKYNGEWSALPYIWNNEQTDAYLDVTGGSRTITISGKGTFEYVIPNFKQCKNCHDYKGKFTPIGPNSRQLNKDRQLNDWAEAGLLKGTPDFELANLADYNNPKLPLGHRARSYLDGNCSYCHRPGGSAKNSGLDLTSDSPTDFSLGIYKGPVAAGNGSGGLQYDIVPGQPEASILHYRMNSTDPAVMMPELGRSLIHEQGVALIAEWIAGME